MTTREHAIRNAITDALREMEKSPDDSTQDIWNEALESWKTGLRINHRLEVVQADAMLAEKERKTT